VRGVDKRNLVPVSLSLFFDSPLCGFVSLCENSEAFIVVDGRTLEMTHTKTQRHEVGREELARVFAAQAPGLLFIHNYSPAIETASRRSRDRSCGEDRPRLAADLAVAPCGGCCNRPGSQPVT
jgi:hypothetical protein